MKFDEKASVKPGAFSYPPFSAHPVIQYSKGLQAYYVFFNSPYLSTNRQNGTVLVFPVTVQGKIHQTICQPLKI